MATTGQKIGLLRDFFADAFRASELNMVLTVRGYEDVARAVNPNVGGIEYFFNVAQELAYRNQIDDAFFVILRLERPRREEDIRNLQESWLVAEKTNEKPSGGTTSSGPPTMIHPEELPPQHQTPDTPISRPGGDGLRATVVANVTVEEGSWLVIRLHVKCENGTGRSLVLDKKYRLLVSQASHCRAWNSQGDLTARYFHSHVEVDFTNRKTRLPPTIPNGKSHEWDLTFKTPGLFSRHEGTAILFGPYVIRPQHEYKGFSIDSHDFDYTFSFKKPGPRWRWLFMENDVTQANDRLARCTYIKKWDSTDCKFEPFSLGRSTGKYPEDMKISFVRIYRPNLKRLAAVTCLAAIVVGLLGYANAHGFFLGR
jgi:hypothetical protein